MREKIAIEKKMIERDLTEMLNSECEDCLKHI